MGVSQEAALPELFTGVQWDVIARRLGLSRRQLELARLICLGYGGRNQARLLGLSPNTVRMHRKALFERIAVHDRVGVPVKAMLAWRKLRGRKLNR